MIKAVEVTRMIAGPVNFVAAKNVNTETGESSPLFFKMTYGTKVMADMIMRPRAVRQDL